MRQSFRRTDPEVLRAFLEASGLSYRENSRSYIFDSCPRCNKRDKLMMLQETGQFICWVCVERSNFRGSADFALAELLSVPRSRIRESLFGKDAASKDALKDGEFHVHLLDWFGDDPIPEEIKVEAKGLEWPVGFYDLDHEFSERGLKYLNERGISLAIAKEYGLKYSPSQRRVFSPLQIGDKLIGWQGRAVFDTVWYDSNQQRHESPKTLTVGDKTKCLMFQDRLIGSKHAVLTEGPFDAIKCHLIDGNTASLGKEVSQRQIEIITGSGVRDVYIGLDPDVGSGVMKLCRRLSGHRLFRLLPAPGYKDLGEMPLEGIPERFRCAERIYPGSLFLDIA